MIVSLIRAVYEAGFPLRAGEEEYAEALRRIERSGAAAQLHGLLKRRGLLEETPPPFRARLEERARDALFRNLFLRNQGNRILEAFEEGGVEAIPLKGVWFAEKYFGHPGGRETSDIDLLVRPADAPSASDVLMSLGYTADAAEIPGHFHKSFVKPAADSPVPFIVELHFDVMRPDTADIRMADVWARSVARPGFRHVRELADDDAFYLICLHGWRHNMDSLKYFLDIIQLIAHLGERLDYEALLARAGTENTRKRIVRTLSIVYRSFPFLDGVRPFPALRAPRWRDADHAGEPRRSWRKYADLVDYQLFSYDCARHRLAALKSWLGELSGGRRILGRGGEVHGTE